MAIKGVGADTAGALLAAAGDNPDRLHNESAFAHLCGVAPIPASSGKTNRYRLNRGGNRDANRALYVLALGRLSYDERTRAYAARRTAEGKSKREIIRCIKRYLAREVFTALTAAHRPAPWPQRPIRQAASTADRYRVDHDRVEVGNFNDATHADSADRAHTAGGAGRKPMAGGARQSRELGRAGTRHCSVSVPGPGGAR